MLTQQVFEKLLCHTSCFGSLATYICSYIIFLWKKEDTRILAQNSIAIFIMALAIGENHKILIHITA